jgi:hypothetical protein
MRKPLTDRTVKALKPAPAGKRIVLWDSAVPGLCIRVTDKGSASFSVMRRLKGDTGAPIRRMIGVAWQVPFPASLKLPYPLETAREDARAAILDMSRGIDPKAKREAAREAAEQTERERFAVATKDFIETHVTKLRSAGAVEAAFKSYLIPAMGKKTLSSITDDDVVAVIKSTLKKGRPYMARHLFAYLSKFFRWAIAQRCYGIKLSPCSEISLKDLLDKPEPRTRILSDDELLALWKATDSLSYPAAQFIKLLLLTGARRTEAAAMRWSEIDLTKNSGRLRLTG